MSFAYFPFSSSLNRIVHHRIEHVSNGVLPACRSTTCVWQILISLKIACFSWDERLRALSATEASGISRHKITSTIEIIFRTLELHFESNLIFFLGLAWNNVLTLSAQQPSRT
jgi:hypothetical protein